MTTIYIVQSGLEYTIDERTFGDEAGLIIYLRARGVTHENIMKALEELVREGTSTIEQE